MMTLRTSVTQAVGPAAMLPGESDILHLDTQSSLQPKIKSASSVFQS